MALRRLLAAAVLALLPIVVWALALYNRLGPSGLREFVWVNNVLRFLGGASHHMDLAINVLAS